MKLRTLCIAGLLSVAVSAGGEARAQSGSPSAAVENEALARNLIAQAVAAYKTQDFAGAARLFEQSYALYPLPLTAYNRIKSLEKLGRLLEAERVAREVRARAAPSDADQLRAYEDVQKLRAEIAERLPTVSVHVASLPGGKLPTVRLDGTPVPADPPQQVDPGSHRVIVEVDGRPPVERTVLLKEREVQRIEVVFGAEPPVGAVDSGKPLHEEIARLNEALAQGRTRQRTIGFVMGGVGLAGLGIGAALGAMAAVKNNQSDDGHCSGAACDPTGYDLRSSSIRFANGSTSAIIAGGIVLAAGVVVVLTAPRAASAPAAQIGLGPRGFELRATW